MKRILLIALALAAGCSKDSSGPSVDFPALPENLLSSYTSSSANFTMLGENDDRATGNYNALLTVTLEPGIDYFVVVSGYDYSETGSYSLRIR